MLYSSSDIQRAYTHMVQSCLNDGFDINILSMAGSQGDESRIDLVKDGIVKRFIYSTKYQRFFGSIPYIQIMEFDNDGSRIYWNQKGRVIKTFNFIKARDDKNYYMVNDNELDEIVHKIIIREDKYWNNMD